MTEQSLKDKTAKGLFWGGLSNGLQQLLNLFFGIFLARLLTQEDYGMVGVLSIFSLIATALQESGFISALANQKEIKNSDYNAVFWFSSLAGLSMYLILFFCAPLIAWFFETPELTSLARFTFLGFLISSTGIAHSAYLFRTLMVKQRAMASVIGLLLSGTTGITLAYLGFSYWGIATQSLVYIATTTCCYWYFSPWRPTFHFDFSPLKSMFTFSSKLLITNIFTHIHNNVFSIILGKFYTIPDVGNYNQANKWNSMGYSLVSGMINGVAQPVLSKVSEEKERQLRIFRKMMRFTCFVSFPAMFGLSLVAPELITIAITDKWIESAKMLQILCISGAFIPIVNLCGNLLISKGKSDIFMWNTISLVIIQLGIALILYPYGIYTLISVYAGINIAWLLVWHHFVSKEIGYSLFALMKDLLPYLFIAGGVMAVTWFCTANSTHIYMRFVAKVGMAASLYILVMWLGGSVTFKECISFILKKKTN
jgi:O-antigen/teichoic acid export membrane protein